MRKNCVEMSEKLVKMNSNEKKWTNMKKLVKMRKNVQKCSKMS